MQLFVTLPMLMTMTMAIHTEKETPIFLCGRQLANARVILCYGSTGTLNKKSFDTTLLEMSDEKWHDDWTWPGRRGALSVRWSRFKREEGLADLCCLKPCTTDVILNFC